MCERPCVFAMDSSDEDVKVEVGFNERFKITMLGDSNVGKSSVLRSLNKQEFNPCIKNTVGALRHRNVTIEWWDYCLMVGCVLQD